jgi:hypothetical protein
MAHRRKYKSGGAVPPAEATAEVPAPPPAPAADDDAEAILRSLRGTERAVQLQRPPQSIEEAVDRLPFSDRRKAFLKKNQVMLDPKNLPHVERWYEHSKQAGNADDSDAQDEYILRGVLSELKAEHDRGVEAAKAATPMQSPPGPELSDDEADAQLDREVAGLRAIEHARNAMPTAHEAVPEPQPLRSTMRFPVTAPVSRDVPSASGARTSQSNSVVLGAEERDMARRSYSWLPPDQAERLYAEQKRRLAAMRAAGTYNG